MSEVAAAWQIASAIVAAPLGPATSYALTFVSSSQKSITLGVSTDLIRGDVFFWGEIMAGALIAAIPGAIACNLFLASPAAP